MREIIKKLRKLKKLEMFIRFRGVLKSSDVLVWSLFFDTTDENANVKYNLISISKMEKKEYEEMTNDYLFNVYYKNYLERGLNEDFTSDTDLLKILGLDNSASKKDVEERFLELAQG